VRGGQARGEVAAVGPFGDLGGRDGQGRLHRRGASRTVLGWELVGHGQRPVTAGLGHLARRLVGIVVVGFLFPGRAQHGDGIDLLRHEDREVALAHVVEIFDFGGLGDRGVDLALAVNARLPPGGAGRLASGGSGGVCLTRNLPLFHWARMGADPFR